jgi:hypothetical protein
VAVHVVARARQQATGRFSLRITPSGFGTPEFGTDQRRVRVAGGALVVEADVPGDPAATVRALAGATLAELADLAAVDLGAPLDVGHDTPPLGDPLAPLTVDEAAAEHVCGVLASIARVLDQVLVELAAGGRAATLPRLWPEHFDVAVETDAAPGVRVNLGGSPGDAGHPEPYLYVGPWTADRPGDPAFWNAPFGALRPLADTGEVGAVAFLLEGVRRLASS